MRTLVITISLVALFAAPALAGDGGISDASLARMGLQGMQPISDAQGMSIRGTSFASVSGYINVLGFMQSQSRSTTGGTVSISLSNSILGVSASTSASVTVSHH
jgi:hypothetical protein